MIRVVYILSYVLAALFAWQAGQCAWGVAFRSGHHCCPNQDVSPYPRDALPRLFD